MSKSLVLALLTAAGTLSPAWAAERPACKLFTQHEASAYVGSTVGAAETSQMPGDAGCSWSDEGAGNKMSISVLPAGNALQLNRWGFESWEGFRSVSGIGSKAYVARTPAMDVIGKKFGGDWQAGAIVGSDYVSVGLKGPKANADAAVSLLNDVIRRRQ